MTAKLILIDTMGAMVVAAGFTVAFRQGVIRKMMGWPESTRPDDPLTYILRISGMMVMALAFAFCLMTTLFALSSA